MQKMAKNLGVQPRDIIDFVMRTQHIDAIERIGQSNNAKVVFVNHTPATSNSVSDSIAAAMLQAQEGKN